MAPYPALLIHTFGDEEVEVATLATVPDQQKLTDQQQDKIGVNVLVGKDARGCNIRQRWAVDGNNVLLIKEDPVAAFQCVEPRVEEIAETIGISAVNVVNHFISICKLVQMTTAEKTRLEQLKDAAYTTNKSAKRKSRMAGRYSGGLDSDDEELCAYDDDREKLRAEKQQKLVLEISKVLVLVKLHYKQHVALEIESLLWDHSYRCSLLVLLILVLL